MARLLGSRWINEEITGGGDGPPRIGLQVTAGLASSDFNLRGAEAGAVASEDDGLFVNRGL